MILHVSVTADRPEATARTLATLLGGQAIPLGPAKGSWTAVGPDPIGNVIEVMARGTELHRSEGAVQTVPGAPARHSGFHVLMESVMSESEIIEVAAASGATAHRSSRGVFGDLIEFWIDDCLLIEVLPCEWARTYRRLLGSDEVRDHVVGRMVGHG
jgi:hypothetical protein